MKRMLLCVGFDRQATECIEQELEADGFDIINASSIPQVVQLTARLGPSNILLNTVRAGIDMKATIRQLRKASPSTKIVVIIETFDSSSGAKVDCLSAGAHACVGYPIEGAELRTALSANGSHEPVQGGKEMAMETLGTPDYLAAIVGECPAIRDLRSRIIQIGTVDKALKYPRAVLIAGETGTGKQLVAQALHYSGGRAHGPFIELNCAAIPATLLEAELFGYEKGAFTDAKTSKPGLFEVANGGTLFLDEISSMDPGLQVKLLKAIEEKSVRRIGSQQMKPVNVRIIAASNWVGELALQERRIRPDLYYRLHAFSFILAPLRERGMDILLLARHVLARIGLELGRLPKQLTREAEALLMQHSWPGNVRELVHVVERAALLKESDVLTAQDLEVDFSTSRSCTVFVKRNGEVQIDFATTQIDLEEITRQLILKALMHVKWNRTEAARLLGISKETLRYRIEKFDLQPIDLHSAVLDDGSIFVVSDPTDLTV